jgi:hypothetical protein
VLANYHKLWKKVWLDVAVQSNSMGAHGATPYILPLGDNDSAITMKGTFQVHSKPAKRCQLPAVAQLFGIKLPVFFERPFCKKRKISIKNNM